MKKWTQFLRVVVICTGFCLGLSSQVQSAIVTPEDEFWHDMGSKTWQGYEWFYFDLQDSKGNQLAFAFLGPNPYDIKLVRHFFLDGRKHVGVLAQGKFADGRRFQATENFHDSEKLKFQKEPFFLEIGKNTLKMEMGSDGLPVYFIHLDLTDPDSGVEVTGDLTFEGTEKGWKIKDGIIFSNPDGNFHKWVVAVPRAKVAGRYLFREVSGRSGDRIPEVIVNDAHGYHDHNYGTLPLTTTGDGWYWGRGVVEDKTLIYGHSWGKAKGKYAAAPTTLVYMVGKDGVLLDTIDVQFDVGNPQTFEKAENGVLFPKKIKIAAQGALHPDLTYVVEIDPLTVTEQSTPYYLRHSCRFTISCVDGKCPSQEGELVSEVMDLRKMEKWGFKKAFFPWFF